MRRTIFDEIVFQAPPLGQRLSIWPPALSVHIAAGANTKGFAQQLPLFARRTPMPPTDAAFPAFCGLLKDLGIPLQTSVQTLEPLSVANVPIRFARRSFNEGFDALELETAEVFEISCSRELQSCRVAQFPLEISAWHELKLQLDTLRDLSSTHTPIGLGIVAGDVRADMTNAIAAGANFVILELPSTRGIELTASELDHLVWSVVAARKACVESSAPSFPIYVDAPLSAAGEFVKLLALGATAISIDAIARAAVPSSSTPAVAAPKGMLSGIGALPPKSAPPNVTPLENKLAELVAELKARLYQQQLGHVRELTSNQLRALSEPAARLAGLSLLEQ
jgi:hypothetical protein